MAPLTRGPGENIISMAFLARLREFSESSPMTDFPSGTSQYSTPARMPSSLSLPEFIAISIAVCLTFVVIVSISNGFGRVRGHHLLLQAGAVPAVFSGYGDRNGGCLETASHGCVNAGINI